MFSDKENIAILTALLREHGVGHAVVCPGSRNAAIVNNLTECLGIECFAATDERSAAFEAMGISLSTGQPTVVCVTSGSALLNTLPAVAEAWYQHVPLIVISADRPAEWIEQLDGQTIEQPGALKRWCVESVNLPEVKDEVEHWNCNWLVNKTLLMAKHHLRPVHINVPLSEPLYKFNREKLGDERVVSLRDTESLVKEFVRCEKVMIIVGQERKTPNLAKLSESAAIVAEPLGWCGIWSDGESFIEEMEEPEMVIYLGGTIVSKRVKEFLRKAKNAVQWYVSADGEIADTFMNLRNVVFDDLNDVTHKLGKVATERRYGKRWNEIQRGEKECNTVEEEVVRRFEMLVRDVDCNVCYANSMAVRYACRYASHNIYCNRGVNGIEGSVSTALGIARGSGKLCICVTGDLSFFYDSNALWREHLPGKFRVIVMNNGGGKIFKRFKGLEDSDARAFVVGKHNATCKGLCESFGVDYMKVTTLGEVDEGLRWLINGDKTKILEYEDMEKD